ELWKDGTRSSKILGKKSVTIGRSANSDFQIDDASISREHLRIEFKDGKLYVTDLGSSNGSLLDKARLIPNKMTPIPDGVFIRPGTAKIKLMATVVEVRHIDEVDQELENITTALESMAKGAGDRIKGIQTHEEKLHKSVQSK